MILFLHERRIINDLIDTLEIMEFPIVVDIFSIFLIELDKIYTGRFQNTESINQLDCF